MGSPATQRGVSVLVVEDNLADQRLVGRHLPSPAYELRVVERLEDAEELLAAHRFDVMLLDLRLPELDPQQVVSRAVAASGGVPIVALTGVPDEALAYSCLNAGVQEFVRKDGLTHDLLRRAIDYARTRARTAELSRRLELAERRSTVAALTSYVAHEINNQAHVLWSGIDRVRVEISALRDTPDGLAAVARADELLVAQESVLEHIAGIMAQLRLLGRPIADRQAAASDVRAVIDNMLALLTSRLRQSAKVSVMVSNCPPVAIPEHKLAQVLVNLTCNAVEAMVDKAPDHRIRFAAEREGDCVRVSVSDTAGGIPEQIRSQVFEPFFTSKVGGTGLGLAIVKDLVESSGGTIEVEHLQGGTAVHLRLPVANAPRAEPTVHTPSGPDVTHRLRVLVVDDDDSVRAALALSLSIYHEVTQAASGRECLRMLAGDRPFDMLLCDVMMPEMNGPDVLEAIREHHPSYARRFAFLSGGAYWGEVSRQLEAASVPVIAKPCPTRDILSIIEQTVARARSAVG